ncbi:hypothetical protein BSL78_03153 [Apostichopus japonicus]|uniref:Fibronectin type-III domain-containing protein n=1 Tax=Stichopus japonicus TaxID=307972 RepID=A0A2G8LI53_STIJA|nr:hypothetical protein BSL78_03153 [Apostichopus japonicus]
MKVDRGEAMCWEGSMGKGKCHWGTDPSAAPTNIRGESSETSLTFNFDEITESERNGVIRMYETKLQDSTVTSSDVPPITKNVTRERVMFDKLKDGTPYIFNVRGYTSVGPGVWSTDVISSTVPGPGPVRELNVHTISHDSVSVTWQPPQNDNGRYDITISQLPSLNQGPVYQM